MDNAGTFPLAALQINAAMSQKILLPVTPIDLSGMSSVTLTMNFKFGSGSGTVTPIVATTLDGGTVWYQIARWDLTNASVLKWCNLTAAPIGITAYADLAAEGITNGLLGDQLALFLAVTGAYTSTTLDIRASVR
jgi:hypothetical protein